MHEKLLNRFLNIIKKIIYFIMKKKIIDSKSQTLEYVRCEIRRGNLEKALAALEVLALEKRDDILLVRVRLAHLEDCTAMGVLPYEIILLEHQRIAKSVIHICRQIEESGH